MQEKNNAFSPREIVSELDRHIVAQKDAKKAVAIALRNRWRRLQLSEGLRDEVQPKNILMIGPTGCGKTEIARRLAKLARAPFIKVEATKFTEVGYVGRDVEQIIRDLLENALHMTRQDHIADIQAKAELLAEKRLLKNLSTSGAGESTEAMRKKLRKGELNNEKITLEVEEAMKMPDLDIPGMPGGQVSMLNLNDILGKQFGMKNTKKREMTVAEALILLTREESDRLLDHDRVQKTAIERVEEGGIVFIDEIDKICRRQDMGADISREGVQRDLLPLIEGTTVSTKYGPVKTDHVLFIASGAFHATKPSDLLPELQGRLPIRVKLEALTEEDFARILREPESSLLVQYKALIGTEDVTLIFEEDAIDRIAALSYSMNQQVENIGARRLHTIIEKLLEDISFEATDKSGATVTISSDYVDGQLKDLLEKGDLSNFIL